MMQKVIQVGNSLGIVIPKELAKKSGLKAGSNVYIQKDPNGPSIVINSKSRVFDSSITPDFLRIVSGINKKYGPALKELAGK